MKLNVIKLLIINLLILNITTISYSALQSDTAWEVRTSGNANNGGCYDTGGSGTDYSQQDSAQLSLTDLATTGAVTTLTSATGGFTSAMVDNCIQIRSGTNFDVGFYEITAFTDTNTVTLDRTPSSGGAGSGGSGDVGGALTSIDTAVDNVVNKNTVWVKAGTYSEIVSVTTTCGSGQKCEVRGYNTTRGDNPLLTNRPVIDGASTRANCITFDGNYDNWMFENFICQDATGTGISGSSLSSGHLFRNFRVTNAGSTCMGGFISYLIYNAELDNCTGAGTTNLGGAYNSYSHDNGGVGFDDSGRGISAYYNNISESNTDHCFESGHATSWLGNIAYNCTGASTDCYSFNDNTSTSANVAYNNIASSCGDDGFSLTAGAPFYFYENNISYNNTGSATSGLDSNNNHNNLTTNPNFNNPSGGDFTITSSSSAIGSGIDIGDYTNIVGSYTLNSGLDQNNPDASGSAGTTSSGSAY